MEAKKCISCDEQDPKRFYIAKKRKDGSPVRASRCMPCARQQVNRRYHTLPKKVRSERSCNFCEYFTGTECRKTEELKPWMARKKQADMLNPKYRDWHKRCFVKMVISQVRSA